MVREAPPGHRGRYARGSVEFSRVANLSDALFAIAMTLLVLRIEAPDAEGDALAGAVIAQWPQLLAFVISFAVVAHFWWVHHGFVAMLEVWEPGLVAITLVLLGAIALVPWPTSLIGVDPTARAAVVPYLGLVAVIAVLHVLLLLRAWQVDAWRAPAPAAAFRWSVLSWGSSALVTFLAIGVALWVPVLGIATLLLTWPVEALVGRFAPETCRPWV
ncbi:MAG: TMEM175 family protein [Egibacteraceae bacterium]